MAAVIAGSPRSTKPASRRSRARARSARADRSPAAQTDVRAETVDEPRVAAARMGPPQAHDVAEEQLEDGSVRHGGQGIRGAGGRGSARVALRGRDRERSTGVTVDGHLRLGRPELGDDPARPGQRAVSLSGAPIASDRERVAERRLADSTAPGGPPTTTPGHDPDVIDRDRLGAGVAQLVDEVLDARAVDRAVDRDRSRRDRSPGRCRRTARTRRRSARSSSTEASPRCRFWLE